MKIVQVHLIIWTTLIMVGTQTMNREIAIED